jgi:hypothetical protein
MAAEVPNPTRVVVLGDYVIPQGPRNRSAIVLSPSAQQMEIKPYWYNLIFTNQFTGKDHEIATIPVFKTKELDSRRVRQIK